MKSASPTTIDASTKAGAGLSSEQQSLLTYWGARIRAARTQQYLPRAELSAAVGLSVKTLQRMEAGAAEIAIGHYLAVANKVGVELLVKPTVADLLEYPLARTGRSRRLRSLF